MGLAVKQSKSELEQITDDLKEEGLELYQVLHDMDTGYWSEQSTFKAWTIWDVVAHLHIADLMALTSLRSTADFKLLMAKIEKKGSIRDYAEAWLEESRDQPLSGPEILERWWGTFEEMCAAFKVADTEKRYVWAGPSMKARMLATARQMETWAHGWEVFDLTKRKRIHTDKLKNIAIIGVKTYGWTFNNRGKAAPEPAPKILLDAPSGARWSWNEDTGDHLIEGSAVEFCQVVTQVRNIEDTELTVIGPNAKNWMAVAQCFAGPPENPPKPGSRT
jgi:uncharacterized protein (TIGR03084 family)